PWPGRRPVDAPRRLAAFHDRRPRQRTRTGDAVSFPRGRTRSATGGAAGGGGRTMGGGMFGRAVPDFTPVPPERRGRTLRRIVRFFGPYRRQVGIVLVAILATSFLGLINPILLKLLID